MVNFILYAWTIHLCILSISNGRLRHTPWRTFLLKWNLKRNNHNPSKLLCYCGFKIVNCLFLRLETFHKFSNKPHKKVKWDYFSTWKWPSRAISNQKWMYAYFPTTFFAMTFAEVHTHWMHLFGHIQALGNKIMQLL